MLRTTYLNLKKPEGADPVNVQDFNDNADTIDTEVNARVKSSGGDIANTKVSTYTASTASFPVPAAGETPKVFMGKIKKFFEDFKALKDGLVTIGMMSNQNINDQNKIPTSALLYNVNKRVDDVNSDLGEITGVESLIYNLKWIPGEYIDNPNAHLKLTGWGIDAYISRANLTASSRWSLVLGIYDHNNGTPMGRQFAIGTSKCMERRYFNGAWQSWVDK